MTLHIANFSHPVTNDQANAILATTGLHHSVVHGVDTHLDLRAPLGPQVSEVVEHCSMTPEEWQTEPIVVVLPAVSVIAAHILAELHGRMGRFPSVARFVREISGAMPSYRLAEVSDLQAWREDARTRRFGRKEPLL